MPLPPAIRATEYTHENGLDTFFFQNARRSDGGWIIRCKSSPVRFYHPVNKVWVVAHRVFDWTPFVLDVTTALETLATLEKPQ
jgi:hypothetical protein